MSVSAPDSNVGETAPATAAVPKRITNAQTVCNEKNEKGKLCNGHLKQLRTAGEPSEIHLRGDDVLFKCQTCGTLYMGPPLGHVRDPGKQHRFVEAELTALLQAAGGTLPVIKKDERGVYVMVETAAEHGHAAKTAAPKTAAPAAPVKAPAATQPTAKPVATPAASSAPKGEAKPDRTLMRRYTYSGVVDTGPIPGESFAQKVERLRAVSAAAKRRAEEGGDAGHAPPPAAVEPESIAESPVTTAVVSEDSPAVAAPVPAAQTASGHGSSEPDRTLMRRSTYVGVVDTGPIPGETFQQKVERLRAVAAAAKQRAEGG